MADRSGRVVYEGRGSDSRTLNEVRGNTVGIAAFFLPDIFGVRPYARRYTIRDNHVHDNNKPNTATPDAILSVVPSGKGILHIGVDDSRISGNLVENNDFIGIAVVDYCAVVQGGPFDCAIDPSATRGRGNTRVRSETVICTLPPVVPSM